ncbi:hypothetical protein [Candidatus Thiothrix anitrata]|uniref:Uncharacterized protein n=1 Tax=Candidatus Thiothrix anitrata TaxID=2823902 RepID=A0ABX7X137_9GAMM|nr:hypothetical protein [Candidatus Thiothrix anitrata]QTR49600.1 hypothetical protein J8380_15395 [Candidatus Thiothrix anitrata]
MMILCTVRWSIRDSLGCLKSLDHYNVARFDDLEQSLILPCPDSTLTLADIYEGVDFTQPAESDA